MKGRSIVWASILLSGMMWSSAALALEVIGSSAGDAGDSSQATFHFDSTNVNFQMTKPDGTALLPAEVTSHYGTTIKIISDGQDYIDKLGLKVEGASLAGSSWSSMSYPTANTVAIDPASGRFKFSPVSSWQGGTIIDNHLLTSAGYYYPKVAINDSGQAFCIYEMQDLGGMNRVWANQYDPDKGWYGSVTIDTGSNNAYFPEIAISSSGQAICVFTGAGAPYRIYMNRFLPNVGWYGAVTIDADTGFNVGLARIAMNSAGQAICAFVQDDGSYDRIYANLFDPAAGWYGAVSIYASGSLSCSDPRVAINDSGNAVCVFVQNDSVNNRIYANQYVAAGRYWRGTVAIDNGNAYAASDPRITINNANQVYSVFMQDDDGDSNRRIYFNKCTLPGSWDATPAISDGWDDTYPIGYLELASNSSGQAFCVYERPDGSNYRLYAIQYANGWFNPITIDAKNGEDVYPTSWPQVALNNDGMAVSVFVQLLGGVSRDFASIYVPGSGWQDAQMLSLEYEQSVYNYFGHIALNNLGKGFATFFQMSNLGAPRLITNQLDNALPYGSLSVNYCKVDPTPTATPDTIPNKDQWEVKGRKIEPLKGEQTSISYGLAHSGQISIKVYNLRGELVKVLLDQYQPAGNYTASWGAENTANNLVASGVYVIHVKTNKINKTQKVIVIK